MADGQFSLDDILNEYPKKDRSDDFGRSSYSDDDLEAILNGSYKSSSEKAAESPKKTEPAEIIEQERFTHVTMPIPEKTAEVPWEEAPDSVKSSLKKAFEEKNASSRTTPVKPEESITKDKYKKDPFAELRSSGVVPKLDKSGRKPAAEEVRKPVSAAPSAVKEKPVKTNPLEETVKVKHFEETVKEKPAPKPVTAEKKISSEDSHRKKVLDEFYKSLDIDVKGRSPEIKAEREEIRRRADEQRIANTGSIKRAEITSQTGLFNIKEAEHQKPSEELMRSYAGEKPEPQPEKSANQYAEVYNKRPGRKPPLEKYSDLRAKDKNSDELSDIYMDKTGGIPKQVAASKRENTLFKGFTAIFGKLKVQKEMIARREELAAAAKEPNPAELPADEPPTKDKSGFSEYYKEKASRTGLQDVLSGFTGMLAKQNGEEPENPQLMDEMRRIKQERRGTPVVPVERSKPSDLNLDLLNDKIIPDTAKISRPKSEEENPVQSESEDVFERSEEVEKAIALKKRRNVVIDNFRLVGDEEETPEEEVAENAEEKGSIDDFNSYDDAASINDDILQLKSTLIVRLAVLTICLLLTAYMALANDFGLPIIQLLDKQTQTPAFVFVNSIIGVLAAFVSYTVIACGISKLLAMKGDCDSLTAAAVIASLVQSFTMLASPNLVKAGIVHNYVPAAIGCLLFNTIGKLLIVSRTERNFRYISGTSKKCAMFMVKDEEKAQVFTRGTLNDIPALAAVRKTEFISDFVKNSYNSDITDRFCRIFTPILIGLALIAGAVAVPLFKSGGYSESAFYPALSVFTGTICICSCFAMMLVANLPMAAASKKLRPMQAAIIGYDSAQDFADTNSIVADAAQLFPQGMVSLYRIKIFSETRIDEAIVEAASLTAQAGSVLRNMFYDIIAGKTELLNPVESYIYEDSMGLCGWINNRRILLGNRDLMINHSIEGLPSAEKEAEYTEGNRCAVYLSISGELSAMFILDLKANIDVENALRQLEKNHIYLMLRSVDSIISINRLSEMFGVSPEMFKLIPFRLHPVYEELTEYQPKTSTAMVCSESFSAMTSVIMTAKKLRRSVTLGVCIQATAMLLGIVLVIALICMKEFGALSVSNTIIYNLIFLIVTLISQLFNKP